MSTLYTVKAGPDFWHTLEPFKRKYSRSQFIEIVQTIKDCIRELQEQGKVTENGWATHVLEKSPFDDGLHYEFHIFDDDALVVYIKRERKRVTRMVGVYDHHSLPSG